ncbi:MAG TPA: SIMPL domain-containing protein [Burkholderiales bacterium]
MRVPLIALLLAALPAVAAQDVPCPAPGTVIHLEAQAAREVPNDLMRVSYFVEMEDTDPARLAAAVNRVAGDALAAAGQARDVKVQSGAYSTYPVRDKSNRIVRWRSRSEFLVEGRDFQELSGLTGKLQSTVQVGGVGFSLSREAQTRVEEALTEEAVAAFQRRAALIAKAAGISGYRIQTMQVNADGHRPPVPLQRLAAAAESVPAPSWEAGTSTVTLRVSGAIESVPAAR